MSQKLCTIAEEGFCGCAEQSWTWKLRFRIVVKKSEETCWCRFDVVSGLTNGKHLQSRTAYAHKYHSCDYKPILQLYTLFKASLWICSGQISLRNITKYQANMWMTQIMFISWVLVSDHRSVTVDETVVVAPIFDVPFYHATKFHHLSSHSWQWIYSELLSTLILYHAFPYCTLCK